MKLSNQVNKIKFGNPRASLSVSHFNGGEHTDAENTTQGSYRLVFEYLNKIDDNGPTMEII